MPFCIIMHAMSSPPSAPDLEALWMPFSSNRDFKDKPRLLARAEGMYFHDPAGRKIFDSTAGLWCCHCGHSHPTIVAAIQQQAAELDFAPGFQMGHPLAFELASLLANEVFPGNLDKVFFANSGSEAVDTALKIALAYHQHRGETERTLLVGRSRAYHGVNFGGISVGGIPNNKKWYPNQLRVAHIRDTHDLERNAFSRGQPEHGAEFADDLLNVIKEHGAEHIAAVIVEPVAGSTGVLVPPRGYLERLRDICAEHKLLLILDEVITAFGRVGKGTAAERFGIEPDMLTFAKGVNSAAVPLGGVAISSSIYDKFLDATPGKAIDFFHGYTYSGHPLAMAAALAAQRVYREEKLFEKAIELEDTFADTLHGLKDQPHVIDVRNYGLMGAIELQPREQPGARAYDALCAAFHQHDMLIRVTGDIIAVSPPLIATPEHLAEIGQRMGQVLQDLD